MMFFLSLSLPLCNAYNVQTHIYTSEKAFCYSVIIWGTHSLDLAFCLFHDIEIHIDKIDRCLWEGFYFKNNSMTGTIASGFMTGKMNWFCLDYLTAMGRQYNFSDAATVVNHIISIIDMNALHRCLSKVKQAMVCISVLFADAVGKSIITELCGGRSNLKKAL